MGIAYSTDMPTCEICRENESVVCCDDGLFRCVDCCWADDFSTVSGEVYDYDGDWGSDDDDEEDV